MTSVYKRGFAVGRSESCDLVCGIVMPLSSKLVIDVGLCVSSKPFEPERYVIYDCF
jgi:hypothetical protein